MPRDLNTVYPICLAAVIADDGERFVVQPVDGYIAPRAFYHYEARVLDGILYATDAAAQYAWGPDWQEML